MTKRTLFRVLIAAPFLCIALLVFQWLWADHMWEVYREQGGRLVALQNKLTPSCKVELDGTVNDQLIAGVVVTRTQHSNCYGSGMPCESVTRNLEVPSWKPRVLQDLDVIFREPEAHLRKSAISQACLIEVRAVFKHTETLSTISINY